MSAQVVTLRETNLRDVIGTLKALVAEMEAGAYGNVTECAVVWVGRDGLAVSYAAPDAPHPGPAAHLLLHMGQLYIAQSSMGATSGDV